MNQIFKWVTITIFIILFGLSIILPWLLLSNIEVKFQIVTSLLGAIASLGTLFIAFLLYDKFGVSQKIINHQINIQTIFYFLLSSCLVVLLSSLNFTSR